MDSGELNPLNKNPVMKYDNFLLSVDSDGTIDKEELARKFRLDVEYTDDDDGFIITQNGNIVKKPYFLLQSTRQINKQINSTAKGFTKIVFAENKKTVKFTNPPESIPIGCWCTECIKYGPHAHSTECPSPNLKSLGLTLRGFTDCLFSEDKAVRNRLRENSKTDIKNLATEFVNLAKNSTDYLEIAKQVNLNYKIEKYTNFLNDDSISENLDNTFTNFTYQDAKNIKGLNKDKNKEYYVGSVMLQYVADDLKKASVRIYEQGKITIFPCPWNEYTMLYKIIQRIEETNYKLTPKIAMIMTASGSFRLIPENVDKGINLEVFYKCFNPTDTRGNKLKENKFMVFETLELPDKDTVIKQFTEHRQNKYEFDISREDRGKLSMKFIKYTRGISDNYAITAQIYNTGIVQLHFKIVDEEAKKIEADRLSLMNDISQSTETNLEKQLNSQFKTIKHYFNLIRDLLVEKMDTIYHDKFDILRQKEVNKTSDKIFNVVPGVMPYKKVEKMRPGWVVEFFDKTKDFTDNYGWISDPKGYIVKVTRKNKKYVYSVVRGEPIKAKIKITKDISKFNINDVGKVGKANSLPLVEIENTGEKGYLLQNTDNEESDTYWVIVGKPENMTDEYLRSYKKSILDKNIYDPGQQVCKKTENGIDIRPDPYSFYANKCPGGNNQYIDRIGVRSRKDNKFYPVCNPVKNENRKEVEDGIVDFILNGLSDEELEEADIDPNIEVTTYGLERWPSTKVFKNADTFAGTFKPGTIDIGSEITFWDPETEEWKDGILSIESVAEKGKSPTAYHKSQLGPDLNFTSFTILGNDGEEYNVRGEHFHPRHRENRSFEGLNKIFPNEAERKEFLINCAKKLNIIKPEIELEKADNSLQKKVLKLLGNLTGEKNFSDIVTGMDAFIENHVNNFTSRAYEAAIIPENSVRSILYIIDIDTQYLIDSTNRIMKVSVDIDECYETIIDGYIHERDYYSIDIIWNNGKKVIKDYLSDDKDCRLFQLQELISRNSATSYPNSINMKKPLGRSDSKISFIIKKDTDLVKPYIGPIDDNESLIQFVSANIKRNTVRSDIVFIPQTGNARFILWKNHVVNAPFVVQLLRQAKEKNHWIVGLYEDKKDSVKSWSLLTDPINLDKIRDSAGNLVKFKTNDFIKLKFNLLSDGTRNLLDPYSNPVKVSKDMAKSFEETRIDLNLITRSVKMEVFENPSYWFFPKTNKIFIPQDSSRKPLVIKD